jgi:ATP synthase protein I
MYKTVALQACITLLAMALAGMLAGVRGVVSAGLAGLVCTVPNLWFVMHLRMSGKTGSGASVVSAARFFVGEFVKLLASCLLLFAAIRLYPAMHWPSLVLGMALVLQACFLAFWKRS